MASRSDGETKFVVTPRPEKNDPEVDGRAVDHAVAAAGPLHLDTFLPPRSAACAIVSACSTPGAVERGRAAGEVAVR